MIRLLPVFLFLLALPARAVDVTLTVPDPLVPAVQSVCESYRLTNNIETLSDAQCIRAAARLGLRKMRMDAKRIQERQAAQAAIASDQATFDSAFPDAFPGARCGNGVVENIGPNANDPGTLTHAEECDDGNQAAGDGCSPHCKNE